MGKGLGIGALIAAGAIIVFFVLPKLQNGSSSSLNLNSGFSSLVNSLAQNLNFGGPPQSSSITRILGIDPITGSITGTEIIPQKPIRPERIF